MLHAAAMLIGLFALGLLATQRWTSTQDIVLIGAAAMCCVLVGARLGGVGRNPFGDAAQIITLSVGRVGAALRGAFAVVRAAVAADVTVKPALVRLKQSGDDDFATASLANLISASPGSVAVATDADGLLVHVIDEDALDASDLRELESAVGAQLTRRAA